MFCYCEYVLCLLICMNILPLLCFAPLIYLSIFLPMFVCYGVCTPMECRKLGRGVAILARGPYWGLFSYLSFRSLVESLWICITGEGLSIFLCYMYYSLWSCWTTLLFICCWEVICQTLLFLLLNSHDYTLLVYMFGETCVTL